MLRFHVALMAVSAAATLNATRRLSDKCDWPIDLSMELHGSYGDRPASLTGGGVRGRSGNAIIQSMVFRLNAAGYGGFSHPWSGLVQMEIKPGKVYFRGPLLLGFHKMPCRQGRVRKSFGAPASANWRYAARRSASIRSSAPRPRAATPSRATTSPKASRPRPAPATTPSSTRCRQNEQTAFAHPGKNAFKLPVRDAIALPGPHLRVR